MWQNKLLGVVGGVLGRNTSLIFQKLFTGKSIFLINQFTFWNFSNVNTIKCIFCQQGWCIEGDAPRVMLASARRLYLERLYVNWGESGVVVCQVTPWWLPAGGRMLLRQVPRVAQQDTGMLRFGSGLRCWCITELNSVHFEVLVLWSTS